MQKITPFLWFNNAAEEAVKFYVSLFKKSKIISLVRYGEAGPGTKASIMVVDFELNGQRFTALNGGPRVTFTPAVSLFVSCKREEEIDFLFRKLSANGEILMPLDAYPFSKKYAFIKDKFGVSWQLMLSSESCSITPCLLFVGEKQGQAEEAIRFYTSLFNRSRIEKIELYTRGEAGRINTVKHAQFIIERQKFRAMDGAGNHRFTFNESISFVIHCGTQQEVDRLWEKLSVGGEKSRCGWLKDKFGVSWQVVPALLSKLLKDKNPEKAKRVMQAMLTMDKIDIKALKRAHQTKSE